MLVVAATATSLALLDPPSPAGADAPVVTAWWSSTNLGDPAPAPPPPPDVAAGDLLVQGSNAAPAVSALGTPPTSSQAVAGLTFELPPLALVGPLTLKLAGTAPPQVTVVACRATSIFAAAEDGAWQDVPSYDPDGCVPGVLKDSSVVFAGVGKLVANDQLSVLVLPGALDRVVFAPPGPQALAVTSGSNAVGPSAPPFGSGLGPPAAAAPPPAAPPALTPPVPAPVPSGPVVGAPPVAAPLVAPGTPSRGRAVRGGLSRTGRRIAAGAVIGAELLGFGVWLLLGRRQEGPVAPPQRGVGRFRGPRAGPAPSV
jgi:hypothetical protein